MELTLGLALVAGVVSFASPCFLPIVPAVIGQLIGAAPGVVISKKTVLATIGSFIAGFSLVFIGVWASIGLLGRSLGPYVGVARVLGGAVLIVMGLHVAGLIDIGLFNRVIRAPMPARSARAETSLGVGGRGVREQAVPSGVVTQTATVATAMAEPPRASVWRSALTGVIFGAGWTPCIGPVLGGILSLATVASTSGRGIALMIAYCLGLGLPMLLVGLGVVRANGRITWFARHETVVSLVSGGLLILTGFLMITNLFAKLAGIIPGIGI